MKKLNAFIATLGLVSMLAPTFATAAAYLKIGDIKGESTRLQSVRWMAPESISKKESARKADATPGTLSITKEIDKSTPQLAKMLNEGGSFEELTIADGDKNYLLKNVKVVSVKKKGNQEVVTLRFQQREEFGQTQPQRASDYNSSRSNRSTSSTKATDYNSSRSNRTTQ
jgi:type VI protein secretion system component Hcp